jgi:hypothetical protein
MMLADLLYYADVDGELVPVVCPSGDHVDSTEFDRLLCLAGCKRFVRRAQTRERPHPLPPMSVEYVLVIEIEPGVRIRIPMTCLKRYADAN